MVCECSDRGCPCHNGSEECAKRATCCLIRVDMHDETGTLFCEECATDAMESGLFRENVKAWIRATRRSKPFHCG